MYIHLKYEISEIQYWGMESEEASLCLKSDNNCAVFAS